MSHWMFHRMADHSMMYYWMSHWMCHWMSHWMTHSMPHWMSHWMAHWLMVYVIECLIVSLNVSLNVLLNVSLSASLTPWLTRTALLGIQSYLSSRSFSSKTSRGSTQSCHLTCGVERLRRRHSVGSGAPLNFDRRRHAADPKKSAWSPLFVIFVCLFQTLFF